MSVCSTLNWVHLWESRWTLLTHFQKPQCPGKVWQQGWGPLKSQSRWLGQGHVSADLPGFGRGGFKLSGASGHARILSQCDGWGGDPAGAGGYSTWHMAMRLRRLGSLFPSLFKQMNSGLYHGLLTVGGTNCDLLCHARAPRLTQRLSETHKHTIMVQWLYLVVQSNPSMWALKLVKGEAHEWKTVISPF